MALRVAFKIGCFDIQNTPLIDVARRDMARGDQVAQPRRRERIVFVMVGGHPAFSHFEQAGAPARMSVAAPPVQCARVNSHLR